MTSAATAMSSARTSWALCMAADSLAHAFGRWRGPATPGHRGPTREAFASPGAPPPRWNVPLRLSSRPGTSDAASSPTADSPRVLAKEGVLMRTRTLFTVFLALGFAHVSVALAQAPSISDAECREPAAASGRACPPLGWRAEGGGGPGHGRPGRRHADPDPVRDARGHRSGRSDPGAPRADPQGSANARGSAPGRDGEVRALAAPARSRGRSQALDAEKATLERELAALPSGCSDCRPSTAPARPRSPTWPASGVRTCRRPSTTR